MTVEGVATLDDLFVGSPNAGWSTGALTLIGITVVVVFAAGDDMVVAFLPRWCTVLLVSDPEFILKYM